MNQNRSDGEGSVVYELKCLDGKRRTRHQTLSRLREKQRVAEINQWAGKNSYRARIQLATKRALHDWFQAAAAATAKRGQGEGVAVDSLVDAIITLGINHDAKRVHRMVSGEADAVSGLLTLNAFTSAILACCSTKTQRERLFRALRGEGAWRRWGGDESRGASIRLKPCGSVPNGSEPNPPATAVDEIAPDAVPHFLTQLSAYRRKILMATVADKYPTSCMADSWTPEKYEQSLRDSRDTTISTYCLPGNVYSYDQQNMSSFSARAASDGGLADAVPVGDIAKTKIPFSAPSEEASSDLGAEECSARPAPASAATQKHYLAVTKGIILAREPDGHFSSQRTPSTSLLQQEQYVSKKRDTVVPSAQSQSSAPVDPGATGMAGHASLEAVTESEAVSAKQESERFDNTLGDGENGADGLDAGETRQEVAGVSAPTPRACEAASNEKYERQRERAKVLRKTSQIREYVARKELTLARTEARWDDYRVMQKRWNRRTPMGILNSDQQDEENRSYVHLSRLCTSEGHGLSTMHHMRQQGSRSFSSRTCAGMLSCRPSTAHSASSSARCGITTSATTVSFTVDTLSQNSHRRTNNHSRHGRDGGRGTSGMTRVVLKPRPVGPIPLNEGVKLRYPLLQLENEKKARQARRVATEVAAAGGREQ